MINSVKILLILYGLGMVRQVCCGKFLLLPNVHEGFSEWRQIIHRMFLIASHSRHTIVEPCVLDSSICPCYARGSSYEAIPLFQILRKDYVHKQFPTVSVISWLEYQSLRVVEVGHMILTIMNTILL